MLVTPAVIGETHKILILVRNVKKHNGIYSKGLPLSFVEKQWFNDYLQAMTQTLYHMDIWQLPMRASKVKLSPK